MKKPMIRWLGLTGIPALLSYAAAGINAVLGMYLFHGFKGKGGMARG